MIATGGLRHIQIKVRDVERSLRFYEMLFGVEEQFRGDDAVFVSVPGGGDLITIARARTNDSPGHRGGVAHFGFAIDPGADLDAAVRDIDAAGGTAVRRGEHERGKPFVYFTDLDGYEVELWTP